MSKDLSSPPVFVQEEASSRARTPQKSREQKPDETVATRVIGWILQGGVLLSALIIVCGLLLFPLKGEKISFEQLLNILQTLPQVGAGLLSLQPQAVITLGLLLLIATPVVRVMASVIMFALEHDRTYVVITGVVLSILLVSIFVLSGSSSTEASHTVHYLQFSWLFVFLIFLGALAAGLLGALAGLGGGILIVPLLTLVFHLPIYFAIGASLISVIGTSSGAAAAYVRDHITNMRVGMFLELATTIGAVSGAFVATLLAPGMLAVIFGGILFLSVVPLVFRIGEEIPHGVKNDRLANWFRLSGTYPDRYLGRNIAYQVTRTPFGLALMYIAGLISGLLGIGSGPFKVLALDTLMKLPLKVSTTTSNFMIGVTAAASAGIYFSRGDIPSLVAAPVALGVLCGALLGARILPRLSTKSLRLIFVPVIIISALEMTLHGLGVGPF